MFTFGKQKFNKSHDVIMEALISFTFDASFIRCAKETVIAWHQEKGIM
jgi:hypothetical protein